MFQFLLAFTTVHPLAPAGPRVTVDACWAQRGSAPYTSFYTDRHGKLQSIYHPRGQGTIAISYVNNAPEPLVSITFGFVAKGYMVAEEHDVGTFSHGVEIAHTFDVSDQIFPLGTTLPRCVVLSEHYADGVRWVNPDPPRF